MVVTSSTTTAATAAAEFVQIGEKKDEIVMAAAAAAEIAGGCEKSVLEKQHEINRLISGSHQYQQHAGTAKEKVIAGEVARHVDYDVTRCKLINNKKDKIRPRPIFGGAAPATATREKVNIRVVPLWEENQQDLLLGATRKREQAKPKKNQPQQKRRKINIRPSILPAKSFIDDTADVSGDDDDDDDENDDDDDESNLSGFIAPDGDIESEEFCPRDPLYDGSGDTLRESPVPQSGSGDSEDSSGKGTE